MAATSAAAAAAISSFCPAQALGADLRPCTALGFKARTVVLSTSSLRRLQVSCLAAKPETLATVQKVIACQLSVEEDKVSPTSKFTDLGADSLDTVEIMMNLEEAFKISLGEEGAEKIVTVQDAADMIQDVISKKGE
ncbi:uncharacterized protein LOC9656920 [Selaginella moellendorffii]|uniref:uncharacterized protein LOC9656920 n=1 Tax=Selaginella moellendorffii TaxID=88036 RepID=UPI000D1C475C|nr:uncharacterized protein LOC9656920 [Selaginella moellendorffii]|eukprot:XP_002961894.2 uncharacterized protein LOC9656920 [Selaginella moellendorffii]